MAPDQTLAASSPSVRLDTDELAGLCRDGRLFAIVDTCGAPDCRTFVDCAPDGTARSLYHETVDEQYEIVAPYLVALREETMALLSALNADWGVFVIADCGFDAVRRQLRTLLRAQLPSGETVYFRFYDALVLAAFLRSCTAAEWQRAHGPLTAFATPSYANDGRFLGAEQIGMVAQHPAQPELGGVSRAPIRVRI